MKRFCRCLRILFSAGAIALCVVVALAWIWVSWPGSEREIGVRYVWLSEDEPVTRFLRVRSEARHVEFVIGRIRVLSNAGVEEDDETPLSNMAVNRSEYGGVRGLHWTSRYSPEGMGLRTYGYGTWLGRRGFLWTSFENYSMQAFTGISTTYWYTAAPHWFLMLPGVVVMMTAGVRWIRRRTDPATRCAQCGYDLRATPERCPECGSRANEQHDQSTRITLE